MMTQFFLMTGLMAGAFIVKQQMDFIQDRDLGFDRDQVMALQLVDDDFSEYYTRLQSRLMQNRFVTSVSAGDIFDGNNGSQPISQPGVETQDATQMDILGAHYDYFKTIGVEVLEGREFSAAFPGDTANGVILNESAVRTLGWDDPVGQRIRVGDIKTDATVVGVVKDFHYRSLHEPIKPLAIFVPETNMHQILIRTSPGESDALIASLRRDWEAIVPNLPFDLRFLDERLQHRYLADKSFSRLIYLFTGLTLLIASLGLYGLVAILLSFRVREIGIRKVLGSSTIGIVVVVTRDFIKVVIVALVIATPFTWYFMDQWLADFAYRIEIQWWVFLVAGVIAMMVATLTVSMLSTRVALAHPMNALRSE
jgi:putative ABC transport system permease protein